MKFDTRKAKKETISRIQQLWVICSILHFNHKWTHADKFDLFLKVIDN